jgi:hypothetical protein
MEAERSAMRHVDFDPEQLQGDQKVFWDAWKVRAEAARQAILAQAAAGEKLEFDDTIWGDLKQFLFDHVFNGFCAYCESPVQAVGFGDAEHFRPKAMVQVMAGTKRQKVKINGQLHPGYYWLAYDWRNLLPACSQCNSKGKGNLFPVAGTHITAPPAPGAPDDLDELEQPLILHPYFDEPAQHLRFGARGVVAAIDEDPRGKESIRVYGLERDALKPLREAAQRLALKDVLDAIDDPQEEVAIQRVQAELAKLTQGRVPYATAALDFVRSRLALLEDA